MVMWLRRSQRERPSKYIGPPNRKARHTNRNRNKRSVLYAPKERELITVVGVQCVRQRSSCGCGPDHRVQLRRTSLVDGQLLRSVMYTVGAREVTSTPENGTWRGEKHDASRKGAVVPRRGGACAPKRAAQIKAAVSVLWQRSLILEAYSSVRGPSAREVRCRGNAGMR